MNDVRLYPNQIHKLRGYIGHLFKDYDVIHNHNAATGKPIYRYPLIQFKLINGAPAIVAVTERAVEIFSKVFFHINEIIIDDATIPIFQKDLKITEVDFGYAAETFFYQFTSPWMALNQRNHPVYISHSNENKQLLLKKTLVGNLLSMSKYLGCWLEREQRIQSETNLEERTIQLKGKSMIGFMGIFKTNFIIPDDLGIGKSVSRGYGTVRRML